MTSIIFYDDVDVSLLPAGADAYAGYIDGLYTNVPQIKAKFPGKPVLTIAVKPTDIADVLDVENGDATIAEIYAWLKMCLAKKPSQMPVIYTSVSNIDRLMETMSANGFVHGRDFKLWSAHYTGIAHICRPTTCNATSYTCDATQFTSKAQGKSLDESIAYSDFIYVAPKPTPPPAPKPVTLTIDGVKIELTPGKSYALSVS